MFNYILTAYIVSTIVIWIVYWSGIRELESELNTYYYVPSPNGKYTDLYIQCDTSSIIILLVPIANFVFIIRSMLIDHFALVGGIAEKVGAELRKFDNEDDKDKGN